MLHTKIFQLCSAITVKKLVSWPTQTGYSKGHHTSVKQKTSSQIKVSLNTKGFVEEICKLLGLSGQEGLKNREIHRPQGFCQGAERINKYILKSLLLLFCYATSQVQSAHTCMCSTTSGSPCAAVSPSPVGGCSSVCHWRRPAEVFLRQAPPNSFLLLRTKTRSNTRRCSKSVVNWVKF